MKFETSERYKEWVESQEWYQTMSLKNGIRTKGSARTDLREELLSNIDVAGKRVLDVGCNSGQYCIWAKQNGADEVVGIDLARRRLEQARIIAENEGLQITYKYLSLPEAPSLGSFDVVFCFAVLTEISDFSAEIGALKAVIGREAMVELDLAKSVFIIPSIRRVRQNRGWGELRRNKKGDWIVSPTLRTLSKIFGKNYQILRQGKGVRYDMVRVYRG